MWDNPRQLNGLALVVLLAAVAMFAWGAVAWAVRQPVFALRQVVIEGRLVRANPAHIQAVIREELRGTFFTLRLPEARASLQRVESYRELSDNFTQQVSDQKAQVENLKSALRQLEQKLTEAQAKADVLIAQQRRARAVGLRR